MPKVSVIIPTYNRADTVIKTIESVLCQSFGDFELIVVDDGSTDDTASVVVGLNDARIRYVYQENSGVSSARNLGLAKAAGEFVCFLDSDDLWPDNFLEVMMGELNQNPDYGAAYCLRTVVFPDGKKIESYQEEHCKSGHVTAELFKKSFIQTSTICFKREFLDGIFFEPSLTNAEDADVWLQVSTRTKFLFIPSLQIIYKEKSDEPSSFSANNCNRIRVLERFYFKMNGDKYISAKIAANKLSHAYRRVAKKAYSDKCRTAALCLYKKAIRYYPFDIRLYSGFLKSCLLKKTEDKLPDWKMPKPLPTPAGYESEGSDT